MTKKENIRHRTQTIMGLKGDPINKYAKGGYSFNPFASKVQQRRRSEDEESSVFSSVRDSIRSSIRSMSSRSHGSSENEDYDYDDPRRDNEFYSYFKQAVAPAIAQNRQDYDSERSWESFASSRRGRGSVIGSIRSRASKKNRSCCRARACLCLLFTVLIIAGLGSSAYIYRNELRDVPVIGYIIKAVANLFDEEETSSPTPVPQSYGPSTVSTLMPIIDTSPPAMPNISRSEMPSHRPVSKTPTIRPSFKPSFRPSNSPTKQIIIESQSPSIMPSLRPSREPTTSSPTTPLCDSNHFSGRKEHYRSIAEIYLYDPKFSDGTRYTEPINWLSTEIVDICNFSDELLLEKIIWALVYYDLSSPYEDDFGNQVTTLDGYLVKGSHCNRYDDRLGYENREWSVACDVNGRITELEIYGRDKNAGQLTSELQFLSKLQKLVIINSPRVVGSIPPGFFLLQDLVHLDLTNLGLSGDLFPQTFYAINNDANPPSSRMKVLRLGSDASLLKSWNDSDKSLSKDPSLNDIEGSTFSGIKMNDYNSQTFPSQEIATFNVLEDMMLDNCNLVGSLPNYLDNIVALKSFSIWGNTIEGSIPLFPPTIEVISLKSNHLNGNIPDLMSTYEQLKVLELGNNPLSGKIPSSLGTLLHLKSLQLNDNNLTGTIPPSLSGLQSVETLFLENNMLTGSIPTGFGRFPSHSPYGLSIFRWINLENNNLSGTLPNFTQAPNVKMFKAGNNNIEGSIPPSLLLEGIWYIHLNENLLSGSLPTSQEEMVSLRELVLHNNELTGDSIPLNGGEWTRKQTYHNNFFRGPIDPLICSAMQESSLPYQLSADCTYNYVDCPCCSECFEGKELTASPSLSSSPSSVPSMTPTLSPRPSSAPSSAPVKCGKKGC